MSKKDYIRLARAFRLAYEKDEHLSTASSERVASSSYRKGIDIAVTLVVAELEEDNPNFSVTKFLDAIYNPHSRRVTNAE
jgi:hypothetical protein